LGACSFDYYPVTAETAWSLRAGRQHKCCLCCRRGIKEFVYAASYTQYGLKFLKKYLHLFPKYIIMRIKSFQKEFTMTKLLILINFSIISVSIYPQENILNERSPFLLRLNIDEENYWGWTVPQSPYIINENIIQIYPGETIYMEAIIDNNIVTQLIVVKEIINAEKTIIVKFRQLTKDDNEKIHNLMMLEILNPFNMDMEYKADIYLIKHNRWVGTSTIPVRGNLKSYESWPDLIGTIALHDFILK
jgi:hypothetical protein